MVAEPAAHLVPAINLLRDYLGRLPETPFLALGEHGNGRGYWIEATLRAAGYDPRWMYDPDPCPATDMNENPLFPVYDLIVPEMPPTTPSILLVPSDFGLRDEWKGLDFALFPEPPEWERETFLAARGYPKALAAGNPSYGALQAAMTAWDVAHVAVRDEPTRPQTWDEFRKGGDPPVPEGLVPYYAAYAFPPEAWWVNRNLGQTRRSTAVVGRLLLDQVRLEWPKGKVPFPDLLKEAKKNAKAPPGAVAATSSVDIPARPRNYDIQFG